MTSRRTIALGMGFAVIATVLSLSDRAPGMVDRIGSALVDGWRRVEIALAIDVEREAIPWTDDVLGHLVLWGGGMVVLGLALRHRHRAGRLAVALFGASLALEVLQALVTASRSLSLADISANAFGIIAGLTVVTAVDLLSSTRSPAQPY